MEESGNDPLAAFLPNDSVVIRLGSEGAEAAAVLKQHLPDARLVRDERTDASLDVVLGNRFADLTPVDEIPEPAPRPAPVPDTVARPCGVS